MVYAHLLDDTISMLFQAVIKRSLSLRRRVWVLQQCFDNVSNAEVGRFLATSVIHCTSCAGESAFVLIVWP